MGGSSSKSDEPPPRRKGASSIYFDVDGVLKNAGDDDARDPEQELGEILGADAATATEDEEHAPPRKWFIIDSRWIDAWLMYASSARGRSPAPGPIRNHRLVVLRESPHGEPRWEGRPGLRAPKGDGKRAQDKGEYRRVSPAVWAAYVRLYPDSGPAIWTESKPYDDAALWHVDQAWMAQEDHENDEHAHKAEPVRSTFAKYMRNAQVEKRGDVDAFSARLEETRNGEPEGAAEGRTGKYERAVFDHV